MANNNRIRSRLGAIRSLIGKLFEDPNGRYLDDMIAASQRPGRDNPGAAEADRDRRMIERVEQLWRDTRQFSRDPNNREDGIVPDNIEAPNRDNWEIDQDLEDARAMDEIIWNATRWASPAEKEQIAQRIRRELEERKRNRTENRRYDSYWGYGKTGAGKRSLTKGSAAAKRRMAYVRSFKRKY
jgi:hypothetical protein